ncbi:MAG: NADP-dependent phosphogluconate dehydrogenase, partial [Akkermansiaceae bacterium]
MEKKSDFGLIGLAVMGQNLVLNVESRGFQVSVYNRTTSKMTEFIGENPRRNLVGCQSLEEFVESLATPRKIQIMVQAGRPVDAVIESLIPLLDPDDIIIDGGNSLYTDTERRDKYVGEAGFRFIGAGVSGGEEGALKGPSIMPGGPASTWEVMKPIFESISAKVDDEPCVVHIGEGGAGHFVKMVHNGIEYADMQLICEVYHLMRHAMSMTPQEIADVFREWNRGPLHSYLIEISAEVLDQTDHETGLPLVDIILDKAGQKGTGLWTAVSSLQVGAPAPTITNAVFARALSTLKDVRLEAAKQLPGPAGNGITTSREEMVSQLHDA